MNILKIVIAVLALTLLISTWRMFPLLNLDYASISNNANECVAVDGPAGPEDLTIDQNKGLAYFATDDRRAYLTHGDRPSDNGALWSLNLNDTSAQLVRIEANYPEIFHPHGISLLTENGKDYLFVVNHPSTTEHQVDIFEITSPSAATLLESITFPELISPNDLHAISRTSFFITNDHSSPRQTLGEKVEDFLRLAATNVLFYNNGKVHEIIGDLYMANGVITNADQSKLIVAESTAERLAIYMRKSADKLNWELEKHIPLNVMPDNLEWTADGKILVASHPKALDFLVHTFDASAKAPSVAHAVNLSTGKAEVIYADAGMELSGSSVAASYKDQLLIGSVFEEKYVHCRAQQVASR
jgi:arylesterase/paraoxonase